MLGAALISSACTSPRPPLPPCLVQVQASTQRVISNTVLTLKNNGKQAVESITVCEQAALRERAALFEVGGAGVQRRAVAEAASSAASRGRQCTGSGVPGAAPPRPAVLLAAPPATARQLLPAPLQVGVMAGGKFEALKGGAPEAPAGAPAGVSCTAYQRAIAKGASEEVSGAGGGGIRSEGQGASRR